MATAKSATPTFHIQPGLNEARRTAAEREHRPIANMVEVEIPGYRVPNGIAIRERRAFFDENRKPRPA